jgi:hydroxyacylglutathione hydrolase
VIFKPYYYFERRWNPMLSKSRDEFVDALSDVPPKPAAMEQILRVNQGREGDGP